MNPLRAQRMQFLRWIGVPVILAAAVNLASAASRDPSDGMTKPRRQQGILTGMPFMANVAARSFVDDLGRKVFLVKAPSRVVSTAPSITESLYALGLGDRIAGVSEFCDYPPEALLKPRVGYSRPNLESIVALRPDLVLAPKEVLRSDVLAKLEQLKIPTYIFEAKTLEDVPLHLQVLGRMFERSDVADRLASDLRQRIQAVKTRVESLPRPRVLYVLSSNPLITVGPGSYIDRMIELSGGINVAARAPVPYPRLSMEEVVKQDPEVLVFSTGKTEGVTEEEQQQWRRWTTLAAVKRNRLHQIKSDLLNRPGPRIVEGLESLAQIIHPESFGPR